MFVEDIQLRFCGLQLDGEGSVWIHQSDYIQDVLTRHDDPPERTTPLDKIADHVSCEDGCPQPHLVKQAQGLAGELLWLVARCRPDLSYPVNLMSQCMLKNPQLALTIGTQILGYLKSTKHWGIKYGPVPGGTEMKDSIS